MSGPARMRDVAALAGVATMTVSRVINGNRHVSEMTRERVFRAIKTLKYRPNTLARSLREQRSRQIGVIVPNIQDPFFANCAQAVTEVAKEHGYSVTIAMSDEDPEAEHNEAILMLQRNLEGLVVIPASRGVSQLTSGEFARMPIVTLDRPIAGSAFDSVVVKNAAGAAVAVEHLLGHGHRRIAFVGLSLDLYTMRERHKGYSRAMTKAGFALDVHCASLTQAETVETLRSLLAGNDPVTAIFCGNNLTARNVLHGLSALRVKVPEEMAVVGFDDFETADLLDPAVTVVSQSMVEMGRSGAEMLFERMLGKRVETGGKQVVLPVKLIVRRSCGGHRVIEAS